MFLAVEYYVLVDFIRDNDRIKLFAKVDDRLSLAVKNAIRWDYLEEIKNDGARAGRRRCAAQFSPVEPPGGRRCAVTYLADGATKHKDEPIVFVEGFKDNDFIALIQ